MRPLSLFLAAALVVVTTSMAGSSESGLPGVGTFAYASSTYASSEYASSEYASSTYAPAAPQIVILAAH
jgi:hypothetical protein